MKTYIALFRGINIVGNNRLPMSDLKVLLGRNGCRDVQTYIQSGNAIFRSAATDLRRLATEVSAAVARDHGFEPNVLVLTTRQLAKAAAANPFPEAEANPKSVHLFFLAGRATRPDLAALQALKAKSERFALNGKVFYLHTPDGFGTSKLAPRVERLLGVPATARNWRTVTTLLEMATAGTVARRL
jgi:uncharacterized protein (DUF1697 family)